METWKKLMKGLTAGEYVSCTDAAIYLWYVSGKVVRQKGQVTKKPPCVTLVGYRTT
ncbi:hypothetical protein ACFQ22_05410 [Lentilactobacillus raoultii]|uniref:Uncharacterized protein n=1 Tax=Lentilactobacillus raoultii TaxID=1987503 RepID=A0ABW3PF44_9LACO|nr:hypothetical protein [Lentilactobacillus raoultii]